ncbi:tetratricopeptide repeat protein [Streptomyces shenzhenensis]|uniref:tetratricopeptide repeat protein n=1 Tax=Streptomyces shenzhenensis TaxID=943815 RepID=UPI0036BBD0EE
MAVGHADQVSYYGTARTPAAWPLLLGAVPAAVRCFQPRPALDEAMGLPGPAGTAGPPATGPCTVLVGTAGVGKTQQAVRMAQGAWRDRQVDLLLWVAAGDRARVVAGYAHAMAEITGKDSATGTGTAAAEQAAQAFLAWLRSGAEGTRRRWLIVLDDVADPEELRGLWPPDHPDGRVLVTTGRRDVAQPGLNRLMVPVPGFTPHEATTYLAEALAEYGHAGAPADELTALAGTLGYLPLALSQAAAHLAGTGTSLAAYIRALSEYDLLGGPSEWGGGRPRRGQPLAELVPGPGALPDGQNIAVPEAWQPALDRAGRTPSGDLARPLLELASLLPAVGIPEAVFTGPAAAEYLQEHRATASAERLRADEVPGALRLVDRLGIVDYTPGAPFRAVRVHPVLQRATREALSADRIRKLAWKVASALLNAAHAQGEDPGFVPVLVDAVGELRGHADAALWSGMPYPRPEAFSGLSGNGPSPTDHELLYHVGEMLGTTGQAEAAVAYFDRLADDALRHQGPYSPGLEFARLRQAHWRGESGDAAGAVAAYEAVFDQQCRFFSPHHQRTLDTRAALGRWRGTAGDTAGAVAAYAELLPLLHQHTFPDSTAVLDARAELARWLGESKNAYGAATAYEALLTDLVRVLGLHGGLRHPQESDLGALTALPNWLKVFGTHRNHAHWRGRAGDAAGAATSLSHLLNQQIQILGPGHPHVQATREELAHWEERARTR